MGIFTGTNASETISTSGISTTVTADPAGSRPGSGADTIYAGGGSDTVDAGGGNDTIYSGAGTDTVYGGLGDDTIDDFSADSFGGDDTFYGCLLYTSPSPRD